MTPQQALSVLEQATGQAPLVRQAHQKVLEAINVLQNTIDEKPKKDKP